MVIRDFNLWCLKKTKFLDEGSIDVDYQWFFCEWNGFWLEHAWTINISILYGK